MGGSSAGSSVPRFSDMDDTRRFARRRSSCNRTRRSLTRHIVSARRLDRGASTQHPQSRRSTRPDPPAIQFERRQNTTANQDRFGDLVDFAALSRYFGGALPRIWSTLPRDAWARPPWTARAIAGRPMLEVRATHFATTPGPRTLVCELYPGILVAEKYGICTVLTYGNLVELLPPRSDDRLGMTSGQAVFAALQFGRQMSSSTRTWSPPQWVRGRT
ncbi:hypothetical protein JOJ86_006223 [Rhodococcus percolatus]|nr:hypothetical protein [Rhodococcus opacus]MBP2208497.1 hypothetical protein [Rhodococcus opacus]